jgi:hypothetical protein
MIEYARQHRNCPVSCRGNYTPAEANPNSCWFPHINPTIAATDEVTATSSNDARLTCSILHSFSREVGRTEAEFSRISFGNFAAD